MEREREGGCSVVNECKNVGVLQCRPGETTNIRCDMSNQSLLYNIKNGQKRDRYILLLHGFLPVWPIMKRRQNTDMLPPKTFMLLTEISEQVANEVRYIEREKMLQHIDLPGFKKNECKQY